MAEFDDLASPGMRIRVRVQPRAAQNAILREPQPGNAQPGIHADTVQPERGAREVQLRIRTTASAIEGAANAAVTRMLAKALGIAPSRLTLLRGAASRDKLFRVD